MFIKMKAETNWIVYNTLVSNSNQMSNIIIALIIAALILPACTYTNPTLCTANTKFYDAVLLQCTDCPSNTARAKDSSYCNCTNSYASNPYVIGFNDASSCISLGGSTYSKTAGVASVFNKDGSDISPPVVTPCVNSYPDATNQNCVPCGPNMQYDSTISACKCISSSEYALNGACYANIATWSPTQPISKPLDYLAEQHAQVGCKQYGLIQSCNLLVNKCVEADYADSNFFCSFLKELQLSKSQANGLPTYTFSAAITDSISISGSSIPGTNTTTVKYTLKFILVQYNEDGSINDIKPMDDSIFSCRLSDQDIIDLQSFSGSFSKACTSSQKTFANTYYYDVYAQGSDGSYNEVPIKIFGTYFKRFTPKNYPGFNLTLTSVPPLQVPLIELTVDAAIGSVSVAQDPSISYLPYMAIFFVVILVVFILNFYRYMRYNPDENNSPYYCFTAILLFFVQVIRYVAVGLNIWLLVLTTFIFCFYKFQQTVYLLLPSSGSDTSGLYKSFEALFYTNYSLMVVAIIIFTFNLANSVDFFLIDWEKEKELGKFEMGKNKKEVSIWRKVLLVNELYELAVSRIINIETVSLFSLLFLAGLGWIDYNQLIPNTFVDLISDRAYTTSAILSYFLISFVIFAVAAVQYAIRQALRIWWPLPIENFIDLCSVSNISIIIFDEALHGYYIHGMNPLGQSQGTLSYIESMFEKEAKAFGKSRSFKLDDVQQCQTFEVVFPFEIRQAFQVKYKSRFNQKLAGKSYNTSVISNPIPEMLDESDYKDLEQISNSMLQSFKYYLQGVKTAPMNVRQKSLLDRLTGCPLDVSSMGKLPVFFRDQWLQFSNVLLSGHQFLLLFNFINFTNIFFIATQNIYYAFFIAFIFEKLFGLLIGFFIKRNISRNTLIDDKFFN